MQSNRLTIGNCGATAGLRSLVFIFLFGLGITGCIGAQTSAPAPIPGFDPVNRVPLYETIQEDWSSLAIGVSHLTPEPPLEAETDEATASPGLWCGCNGGPAIRSTFT